MSRWLVALAVAVLALLGLLLWKVMDKPPEPQAKVDKGTDQSDTGGDVSPHRTPDAGLGPQSPTNGVKPRNDDEPDSGPKELIDPKSDLFNHRIDVTVGNELRAAAAFDCDESGMDPDAAIKLNYRVKLVNGRGSITDVKVMKSEVTKKYEECFIRHVSAATFRMDDMPDFEEGDQELYTRVRSMKKYRSRAKFENGE